MSVASSPPSDPTPSSTEDDFDRLPSSVIVLIFNRVKDIKALGRCCAVSKRFHSLVLQTDTVLVKVDCVISNESDAESDADPNTPSSSALKPKGIWGNLVKILLSSVVKPFQALHQILLPKKGISAQISHHSPVEVLKNFKEIRKLEIELPAGELGVDRGALLKWNAEFGSSLDSCVILGATSFKRKPKCSSLNPSAEDESRPDDAPVVALDDEFCTNGDLKLRVVWTITSLIAASARHYLLREIVAEHPTIEDLVLTDAEGQGTLRMGKDQLEEFRRLPMEVAAVSANRTQVPALNMKLWYAERLELPESGCVMEGATLVAIRPVDRPKESEAIAVGCFNEPFGEAARAMVKRKTYLLEMNPF
ncbi:hypothetical protein ACLOJK_032978 [Asimina triloba]